MSIDPITPRPCQSTSTLERVKNIISDRMQIDKSKLTEATNIEHDLRADSLDLAELEMDLEDAFALRMHALRDPQPKTIGEIVTRINNLQEAAKGTRT